MKRPRTTKSSKQKQSKNFDSDKNSFEEQRGQFVNRSPDTNENINTENDEKISSKSN